MYLCKRFQILALISVGLLSDIMECSLASSVLINEVNADTPGDPENTEYIELWNSHTCGLSLAGLRIATYNGKLRPPTRYKDLDLSGYCIPGNGAFVIGSRAVNPRPDLVVEGDTWLQNGNGEADGVVVYLGQNSAPMKFTQDTDFVDVIVHDRILESDTSSFMPPLPSQPAVFEDESWNSSGDEAMSRCSNMPKTMSAFSVKELSPGAPNSCQPDLVTRWPSPCSNTVFADPPSSRGLQYKTRGNVVATSPLISNQLVRSLIHCSLECSASNLCTHFSYTPQTARSGLCSLHSGCTTELTSSIGGIVGEKFYRMSAKNTRWPHEVPLS